MKPPKFTVTLLILLACVTACNDNIADTRETIKIGVSAPLTGPLDVFGQYVVQGISLVDLGESGHDVELVFEDDACDSREGLSVARKLVLHDEIDYLVGPFCASVIHPTSAFYETNNVLRLVTGLGVESIKFKDSMQYVPLGDVESLMKELSRYSIENGINSVSILYMEDDYGEENQQFFAQWFEEFGGNVIGVESFQKSSNQDFRTDVLKLVEEDPDGLFVVAVSGHLIEILETIDELGIDVQVLSIRNTEDTEIIAQAGDPIEEVIFPSITGPIDTPVELEFQSKYSQKFGAAPEVVAAAAFDSLSLLLQGIQSCGDDTDCVHAYLENVREHEGASGNIVFDELGFAQREVFVKQVKNKAFEIVG